MNAQRRRSEYTDSGKRGDDITVKAFGVEVNASGKTVVNVILAAAVMSAFWLLYAFQAKEADERRAEHALYTYVLTLSQDQRERVQPYLQVPREFTGILGELRDEKAAEKARDETHKFDKK
jgi:hypothetical protein